MGREIRGGDLSLHLYVPNRIQGKIINMLKLKYLNFSRFSRATWTLWGGYQKIYLNLLQKFISSYKIKYCYQAVYKRLWWQLICNCSRFKYYYSKEARVYFKRGKGGGHFPSSIQFTPSSLGDLLERKHFNQL